VIGIYKLTSPSGRIYIGQSIDIQRRWRDHRIDTYPCKLRDSVNKYGFDNFFKVVLEECSIELLNERERYWQDFYNTTSDFNLNLKLTSTTDKSGYFSQELRDKMSKSQKKYNSTLTEEQKLNRNKKNSESTKGKKLSVEHIENSRVGIKKYWETKIENQTEQEKELLSNKMSRVRRSNNKEPAAKKVINTETGEIFDSIKLAADSINISMDRLSDRLRGVVKNNTNLKYYK